MRSLTSLPVKLGQHSRHRRARPSSAIAHVDAGHAQSAGSGPGASPERAVSTGAMFHPPGWRNDPLPPKEHARARCDGVGRQLKSPAVRLVCFGDIHMAFRAIDHLAPVLREADCAILTGDLTHFGDPPDAFRVVDAVRQYCPSVLAVTGNLDMPAVIAAFAAAGISLHGEGRRLGGLGVFGCGGSNITPMDTPTELEEEELRDVLERAHAGVGDAPRRLMICHTPPHATRLDRLMDGRPVGSPAVRAFIETHRPDLAVVGHIHEGRGVDRLGPTLVMNAGALRDGGYVVVDHDGASLTAELRSFRTPCP